MKLYANAFHFDAGRCVRFVYEPSTSGPMACQNQSSPGDAGGYRWAVDAWTEQASHLG